MHVKVSQDIDVRKHVSLNILNPPIYVTGSAATLATTSRHQTAIICSRDVTDRRESVTRAYQLSRRTAYL